MGRTAYSTRIEDLLDLDIRRVARDVGRFDEAGPFVWEWFRRGQRRAVVLIEPTRGGIQLTQGFGDLSSTYIRVLSTQCNYGGVRVWWSCPQCSSRVAVLYAGKRFACRQCHGLTYSSQLETEWDRAVRRSEKFRSRLGWEAGILKGEGEKPKGMHWTTFQKLKAQHRQQVTSTLASLAALRPFRSLARDGE